MIQHSFLVAVNFIFGLIVFAIELENIVFKFTKTTPFGVRAGSIMLACGALFSALSPTYPMALMVVGRVFYSFFNRRFREEKQV